MIVNILNLMILCGFFYGRSLHTKNSKAHGLAMIGVILSDLLLLLFLTLFRNALDKVEPSMSLLLKIHIAIALVTVIAYGAAIFYGLRLLQGVSSARSKMRFIDKILVPSRTMVFITSFMLYLSA